MKVHLCHINNPVDGSLFPADSAPYDPIHPSQIKRDHTDDGEPEEEDVACLPCLIRAEYYRGFTLNIIIIAGISVEDWH